MSGGLVTAAYIVAAILFILVWRGFPNTKPLSRATTTVLPGWRLPWWRPSCGPDSSNVAWILLAMVIGGAIGIRLAKKVEMTEMPELVAILHSFVGLAAVLVGFNSYLQHETGWSRFWSIFI